MLTDALAFLLYGAPWRGARSMRTAILMVIPTIYVEILLLLYYGRQ